MFTTLVISGCSIVYELLISAVSSYILGDSIMQFSITIGLYMFAMGIGSWLTKFIKSRLFNWLVSIEILIGILGGTSALVLFMSNLYLPGYHPVMYLEILLIGLLAGLEIPLLTRIIEEQAGDLRLTLSNVFSFDYIGALIGSIAFPLLLLPQFGYFSAAFVAGTLNLAMAIFIAFKYRQYIVRPQIFQIIAVAICSLMVVGILNGESLANKVEQGLYRDKIIHIEQTPYQKLVLTQHKNDIRLFINGNIQFSSFDEYRYHEALVHVPMSVASERRNVLILGGGDGMALREILKYPDVEHVDMVDLDKGVVELCKTHPHIVKINENALMSDKLTVHHTDAFKFLEERIEQFHALKTESIEKAQKQYLAYDVIIVDLPDPNNESLNKLYTNLFYRLCRNNLAENGVMVVQSTTPYYASDAFWCIHKTVASEFPHVYAYHALVPTFGDWGFQLALNTPLDVQKIELTQKGRFLSQEMIPKLFVFAEDEKSKRKDLKVNALSAPVLLDYYLEAERNYY